MAPETATYHDRGSLAVSMKTRPLTIIRLRILLELQFHHAIKQIKAQLTQIKTVVKNTNEITFSAGLSLSVLVSSITTPPGMVQKAFSVFSATVLIVLPEICGFDYNYKIKSKFSNRRNWEKSFDTITILTRQET